MLQSSLESHSDSIHSTLHRHLIEVDSKIADLRLEGHMIPIDIAGSASRTLNLSVP